MRRAVAGILIAIFAFVTLGLPNATADTSITAEIFATNNTAVITNQHDPRLHTLLLAFASEVREMIHDGGGRPGNSTRSRSGCRTPMFSGYTRPWPLTQWHKIAWTADRTVLGGTLILVADLTDYSWVREFVTKLGNEQSMSIHYGAREFVG